MKKMYTLKVTIFLTLFIVCIVTVKGQNTNDTIKLKTDSLLEEITDIDKKVQQYISVDTIGGKAFRHMLDSLLVDIVNKNKQEERDEKGLLKIPNNWSPFGTDIGFRDTVVFDPAFLPVVFDGKLLPDNFSFISSDTSFYESSNEVSYHLISPENTMQPQLQKADKIREMRRSYYTHNPQDVWVNAFAFDESLSVKEAPIKKSSIFDKFLVTDDVVSINTPNVETITIKKSHWKKIGSHTLQASQNQLSDNWSGGGNSSYSILNHHKIELNYKNKKISFNNLFEWKLNLQKTQGDTLNSINFAEDYFKIYSVFGLEAFKKWSYSANLTVQTPIFSGYKINTENKLRTFLSPLDVNLGIGMRYELENTSPLDKYRKIKLTLDLSPLSLNYRYISDKSVINKSTSYGLEEGKRSKLDFGSNINANLAYSFNRYCSLNSRIRYFTDYDRVLFECENKVDYALNRFFSVSLGLYVRYDDNVSRDKHDKTFGYFQYNELLLFGLNYKW